MSPSLVKAQIVQQRGHILWNSTDVDSYNSCCADSIHFGGCELEIHPKILVLTSWLSARIKLYLLSLHERERPHGPVPKSTRITLILKIVWERWNAPKRYSSQLDTGTMIPEKMNGFEAICTPCIEWRIRIVFDLSPSSEGVRNCPCIFGRFSEGTFFPDFGFLEFLFLIDFFFVLQNADVWVEHTNCLK